MARTKSSPKKLSKKPTARRRAVLKPRYRLYLPWPAVFFIILVIGVLLAGWTFQAGASDIHVTGRVPAPALSGSASATNISNGSHFSTIPIHIIGTCPLSSYVSIYTNDFYRGSTLCSATGGFEIDSDLFPGLNLLSVRAYNITDEEGPRSDALEVFYDVPVAASPATPTNTSTGTAASEEDVVAATPLVLTTNYQYMGATVGQTVELEFEISGGNPPYALSVDWGDGEQTLISQKNAGKLTASHIYKKSQSGQDKRYTIKAVAVDADKAQAYLQLFVIINSSTLGSIVANTIPTRPSFLGAPSAVLWIAYGTVALMALSFFLGEREELSILRRLSRRR